jgi:membrane-associated phospholipid phosphatase
MKRIMLNRKFVLAFAPLVAFAVVLSYAASIFPVLPLDLKSYHEVQEEASPLFNELMKIVSYLGEASMATALTVIAVVTFALRRQWLEAIFMLATTSNILLTFGLKELFHRARPFPMPVNVGGFISNINQYSYPSGHVLFFVVFFGFFAYLAWMNFTGSVRILVVTACSALIVLIGPSRVFLGAHWASDVLGSYVIGTIWLSILILAYQWAIHQNIQRSLIGQ